MLFDQLFTWSTDKPRHATDTYGDPVKSNRPPICFGFVAVRVLGRAQINPVPPVNRPRNVRSTRRSQSYRHPGHRQSARMGNGGTSNLAGWSLSDESIPSRFYFAVNACFVKSCTNQSRVRNLPGPGSSHGPELDLDMIGNQSRPMPA